MEGCSASAAAPPNPHQKMTSLELDDALTKERIKLTAMVSTALGQRGHRNFKRGDPKYRIHFGVTNANAKYNARTSEQYDCHAPAVRLLRTRCLTNYVVSMGSIKHDDPSFGWKDDMRNLRGDLPVRSGVVQDDGDIRCTCCGQSMTLRKFETHNLPPNLHGYTTCVGALTKLDKVQCSLDTLCYIAHPDIHDPNGNVWYCCLCGRGECREPHPDASGENGDREGEGEGKGDEGDDTSDSGISEPDDESEDGDGTDEDEEEREDLLRSCDACAGAFHPECYQKLTGQAVGEADDWVCLSCSVKGRPARSRMRLAAAKQE